MAAMSRNKGEAGEREAAAFIARANRLASEAPGPASTKVIPTLMACLAGQWRSSAALLQEGPKSPAGGPVRRPGWQLQPVLFYRLNRDEWRAVWPLSLRLTRRGDSLA